MVDLLGLAVRVIKYLIIGVLLGACVAAVWGLGSQLVTIGPHMLAGVRNQATIGDGSQTSFSMAYSMLQMMSPTGDPMLYPMLMAAVPAVLGSFVVLAVIRRVMTAAS